MLALSAFSADIASALDVDEVIKRALAQVVAMTHQDAAAVTLVEPRAPGGLRLAGSTGLPEIEGYAQRWLPLHDTLIALTIRSREPSIIPQATADSPHGARLLEMGIQSVVTVPLVARERVIGVLQVGTARRKPSSR